MQKDLLLIKPKSEYNLQKTPPLGLGFISAYVKKAGYLVDILDCNVLDITPEKLLEHTDLSGYRLIGLQAFSMDMIQLKKYIDVIKAVNMDIPVIVGGPAPSSDPEGVVSFLGNVDFIAIGEGEQATLGLLSCINAGVVDYQKLKDTPNLAWVENGDLFRTSHAYVEDLDEVGAPDWDGLNPGLYSNAVHGFYYRKMPVYPILVSRGCPFKCSFCGGRIITGYKVRYRSIDSVIDEIEYLNKKYNMQEFQIIDDNFTASPAKAKELADKLAERELDLYWTCPNGLRIDTLNSELLDSMKKSGCYEIAVGIESGDKGILKDMGKHLDPAKVEEKIQLIRSKGISITGFVMVGYPGDTRETLKRTMDFVLKLPLIRISLTRFIPLPNTPITDRLIASGAIKQQDMTFSYMDYGKFNYIPPGFTAFQLRYYYLLFFLRFLLRPRIIIENLKGIRSLSHLAIVCKKLLWFLK